jgi:hypothetical protein
MTNTITGSLTNHLLTGTGYNLKPVVGMVSRFGRPRLPRRPFERHATRRTWVHTTCAGPAERCRYCCQLNCRSCQGDECTWCKRHLDRPFTPRS